MNWGLFSNVCALWLAGLLAAPHLTGFVFKFFVRIVEAPVIGSLIISYLKKQNRFVQVCFFSFLGAKISSCRFFLT